MIAIGNSCVARGTVMWRLQTRGKHRLLATFDFDNTIIDGDCCDAVHSLMRPAWEPVKFQKLVQQVGWIKYMRHVLRLLHDQQGLMANEIVQQVRQLPAVPGMLCLLRRLAIEPNMDMCILSDANSCFISEWLTAHRLANIFAAIYTNPARMQPNGYLQVDPYEQQTHCAQCPPNLCKGSVINALMNCSPNKYKRIIYVGDGCNDLCPIRCLRQRDVACIRRGEELHERLPAHIDEIRSQILIWRNGHELQHQLFSGIL